MSASCRYCRAETPTGACAVCDLMRDQLRRAFDKAKEANEAAVQVMEMLTAQGAPDALLREEQCRFLGLEDAQLDAVQDAFLREHARGAV